MSPPHAPKPSQTVTLPRSTIAVSLLGILVVLAGCTAAHQSAKVEKRANKIIAQKQKAGLGHESEFTVEPPEETLRRRLLTDQNLPYVSDSSLGSQFLKDDKSKYDKVPTVHPPTNSAQSSADQTATPEIIPFKITLQDALQIAAANSRDYQSHKESVFRSALSLDLEREDFRTSFSGLVSSVFSHNRSDLANPGGVVEEKWENSAVATASQALKTGGQMSLRLGLDLVKILEPGQFTRSVYGDASISVPLLRGAGRKIAAESLTQAERNTLYAIYDFEEYKRSFAVRVASEYFSALQRNDQVRNAEENYRSLISATRRARRLLQAGDLPPIQVDQALQDELRARNRWISALATRTASLDSFKVLLGLPADATIELNREDFDALAASSSKMVSETKPEEEDDSAIPPADAPIVLEPPSDDQVGPYEFPASIAIDLAFNHRLDLRIAEARVEDAQRGVKLAKDGFLPGLTLSATGTTSADKVSNLETDHGNYSAKLLLDLPFDGTRKGIAYRQSLLSLESAVRSLQALEDDIKLSVRSQLRTLREARESLQIQSLSVTLARRRVRGADLNLQAGRVQIRDLLDAQEDLLSAQNAFTTASVDYRLAELELQRDLGILEVGSNGLWQEFDPKTLSQ